MTARQCGWCPMLLPDDPDEWRHHHFAVHGQAGWSVRFIQGDDWDVAELVTAQEKGAGIADRHGA